MKDCGHQLREYHTCKPPGGSMENVLYATSASLHNKIILSGCLFKEEGCHSLASTLKSNSSNLKKLDLSNNDLENAGVQLLFTGLVDPNCKLETLRLSFCGVTEEGCDLLASALMSNSCHLRELDLSNNDLGNSGVKFLSSGLGNPHCKLETLRSVLCYFKKYITDVCSFHLLLVLSGCLVTEEGCASLVSALKTNPSHLKELDLSYNHPGDLGVRLLSAGLEDPHWRLEKLKYVLLSNCGITEEDCATLVSAVKSNPSHLKELDLSYNQPYDSGVIQLSAILKDPQCRLETLNQLDKVCCDWLASALMSNSCHLRELDLSNNDLGNSGVKRLASGLGNPHCKLETLRSVLCYF
uniref:NACHT LRR and PYD domain-containing protein n=1 Tax=Esox lucius TaxID=8010 RepID=A0AAY5K7M2_ESOLU